MIKNGRESKIAVFLLLITILFAFNLPASAAKTTLTVMDWKITETPETQEWFQYVKEWFEAENPDVEIEYVPARWQEYRDKLMVAIASGTGPDVISLSVLWARDLWNQGALVDLTPYVEQTPDLNPKEFIPVTQLYNQKDGHIYGITNAMDESLLIYNTDFFAEAGLNDNPDSIKNWDQFASALKKLTITDSSGNTSRFGAFIPVNNAPPFISWLNSNGGSIYNSDLTRSGLNTPEAAETAKFLVDLQQAHVLGGNFNQQSAAIAYAGNSKPYRLSQDGSELNFNVMSLPAGPSGNKRGAMVWGNMDAISSDCKHPDIAWKFIRLYTSLRGNTEILKALQYVNSPRLDFYRSPEWLSARKRYSWMPQIPEIAFVGGVYPFLRFDDFNAEVWKPVILPAIKGETAIGPALAQGAELYDQTLQNR